MYKISSGHALLLAASMALLAERCEAQFAGRDGAEIVMRELMPATARCERFFGESLSYCRYQTADSPGVVFEISFGADGPAGSLTYDVGNSEGRRFLTRCGGFSCRRACRKTFLNDASTSPNRNPARFWSEISAFTADMPTSQIALHMRFSPSRKSPMCPPGENRTWL